METSLHRELKTAYAGPGAKTEIRWGRFRIDAVRGNELIEIQHGSLAAIRDKVRELLVDHRVLIVKPIVARKLIIKQNRIDGDVVSRRTSPKRGRLLDLFEDLIYFTRLFPHPRLRLEAVLVDIEEWRYPGHGRRRRWRHGDHVVADQRLIELGASIRLRKAADLLNLLPTRLANQFQTAELAGSLGTPRPVAQRIAYCLREMGAVRPVGKHGNAWIYEIRQPHARAG